MSDEESEVRIRNRERAERRRRRVMHREELEQLARFMGHPAGRRWFYNLLASCHVYSSSFSANALSTAFAEGERNVGIKIGALLTEAAADQYFQMIKEAQYVRPSEPDPDESDSDGSEP